MFQIWVETDEPGAQPGWGMMPFPKEARDGSFQLLASGNADDGALTIHADARVLGATVGAGKRSSSTPTLRGTSTWCRRPRFGSTVSPPMRVMASPSRARNSLRIEAEDDAELVLVDAR